MTTARLQAYRQSPRKMRLVSDLVKGKSVDEALRILSMTTKAAAKPIGKLLASAARSAKDTITVGKELYIKEFRVDAGPTLKRSMPRARGSAYPILKRTAHVFLSLDAREEGRGAKKTKAEGVSAAGK